VTFAQIMFLDTFLKVFPMAWWNTA